MPRRVAQANAWIREASDQSRMNVQDGTGMADAQYALGAFYNAGLGVPQDYIRAYFWFSLAVAHWPSANCPAPRAHSPRDRWHGFFFLKI